MRQISSGIGFAHAAGLLSTAKRSTLSPEMPTVAEATGIANFDFPL
jgi:hypothetical protein